MKLSHRQHGQRHNHLPSVVHTIAFHWFCRRIWTPKIELASGAGDKGHDHVRVGGHTLMMIGSSSARTEEASRAEPVTIEARLLKPFILKMEKKDDVAGMKMVRGIFKPGNGPQPEVSVTTKRTLPLSKRA
jgi:hypothetical protein